MSEYADSRHVAVVAGRAIESKKGDNVAILDVGDTLGLVQYFVIGSARNDRQVTAVVDNVERQLRDAGVKPIGREGVAESQWVLLDYGDVVIHVFRDDVREVYDLERLFADSARLGIPKDRVRRPPSR